MRVFVSGSFDPLHSGHIRFFRNAARYGDVYVGIGSDDSIEEYKHDVFFNSEERLKMIRAIRYVKDANVNPGMGPLDFLDNPFFIKANRVVVNYDQDSTERRKLVLNANKEYIVMNLKRDEDTMSSTRARFILNKWKLQLFSHLTEDITY